MRKKTEARRQAILAAAAQEFAERGYQGASMSAIVARLGGSKQTLYGYFPSKEALFAEVVGQSLDPHIEATVSLLEEGDVARSLRRCGEYYLSIRQQSEFVSLCRLLYGEAGRSDIGRLVYQRGKTVGVGRMAEFLGAVMESGRLRRADPIVAALHLFALLDAELVEPVVLGVREPAGADEIAAVVDRAVSAFLAAYAPERKP